MTDTGVVVLSGPPCSGKTTVARAIAETRAATGRRWRLLEVDSVFDLLFPDSDRNRDDRMRAYDGAHLLARMLIDQGDAVLLECTYARRDQRAGLVKALNGSGALLRVVEFVVSPEEAATRFRARTQITDLDDESLRERVEGFAYCAEAFRVVSAQGTPDDHARSVLAWLGHEPPAVDQDAWVEAGRGWS
jgi:predicted kinase